MKPRALLAEALRNAVNRDNRRLDVSVAEPEPLMRLWRTVKICITILHL